jgi:hypothetical protein
MHRAWPRLIALAAIGLVVAAIYWVTGPWESKPDQGLVYIDSAIK